MNRYKSTTLAAVLGLLTLAMKNATAVMNTKKINHHSFVLAITAGGFVNGNLGAKRVGRWARRVRSTRWRRSTSATGRHPQPG